MKIAIVGSGIAGLTAAWLWSSSGHQVTLFEKHRIGLDGHSLRLPHPDSDCCVDVPLRFFNQDLWPSLSQLYRLLEIELLEIETSQSFSHNERHAYLTFDLNRLFRQNPAAFLNPISIRTYREILRLKNEGSQDVVAGLRNDLSFAQYLSSRGYSKAFQFGFLYPILSSTVCTCSFKALNAYPAIIVLETLMKLTTAQGGNGHRLCKARFGTRDVVQKLLQHRAVIVEHATVMAVQDFPDHVEIKYFDQAEQLIRMGTFDHAIIATQANQARSLLVADATLETDMLANFEYEQVEMAVHSDSRLMPRRKKDWSAFNTISSDATSSDASAGSGSSMCSIWINRLDREFGAHENVFQTINPIMEPESQAMLYSCHLHRPVVNQNSFRGWRLLDQLHAQPDRRIWFAGSYASYGVPLLESAVVSVLKVAAAIGMESPLLPELTSPSCA